jgi:hypothetical protein
MSPLPAVGLVQLIGLNRPAKREAVTAALICRDTTHPQPSLHEIDRSTSLGRTNGLPAASDRPSPAPPREVCPADHLARRSICTGYVCLPRLEFDCARTSLDPTSPHPMPAAATIAIATIDHVKKPPCFAKSRNSEQLDDDGHQTMLVGASLRSQLCRRLRSRFVPPSPTPRTEPQTAVATN